MGRQALATTPAGVSGAVLLLPIQLSILHVPSPAVTPTNLTFNVASVPGGLLRFRHERRLFNKLTLLLVAGTLPGVVAGAVIRVELLSSNGAFTLVAAGVLLPLGLWLALGSQVHLLGRETLVFGLREQVAQHRLGRRRARAAGSGLSHCLSARSAGSTGSAAARCSHPSCLRSDTPPTRSRRRPWPRRS